MKFSCTREALARALSAADRAAGSKLTEAVGGLLLVVDDSGLRVTGTDMALRIEARIGPEVVEVEDAGVALIPADRFAKLVAGGTSEVARVEVVDGNAHVDVGSKSKFGLLDAESFPQPDEAADDVDTGEVDAQDLCRALAMTVWATTRDRYRYALGGVFARPGGKKGTTSFAGSNGKRLSIWRMASSVAGCGDPSVILSAPWCEEARRLLDKWEGAVRVGVTKKQIVLHCGDVTLCGRLVEGLWPDWRQILQRVGTGNVTLSCPALDLIDALEQATLWTDKEVVHVKFRLPQGEIEAKLPGVGESTIQIANVQCEGAIEVCLPPADLLAAIKVSGLEEITLRFTEGPSYPAFIKEGPWAFVLTQRVGAVT